MTTTTETCTCARCTSPARHGDQELAAAYPSLNLSVLCQTCADFESSEDKRRLEVQRQRTEAHQRNARLEMILPPEMRRTEISDPRFKLGLWLRVQGWLPSSGRWLGIVGGAGQCKTRCLSLLAESLILSGHRLMWTSAVDFQDRVDDLRSDERGIKNEATEYFREARRAPILILDDFGKNTWTPTVEKNLFSLIDHRKSYDLPILWTSNTHPIEIGKSGQMSKDRAAPIIGRLLEASEIITL